MSIYHLLFDQKPGESGVVVTARTPAGERFAVGHGSNLPEALKDLRRLVGATMTSMAADGDFPLAVLACGKSENPDAAFTPKELFPVVLRFLRTQKGLTQSDVAQLLSITQPSYAEYEKVGANPTLDTIERLERVLESSILPVICHQREVA